MFSRLRSLLGWNRSAKLAEKEKALPFTMEEFRDALQEVSRERALEARLDLTQTTRENKNHWKNADGLSARSSYSLYDRQTARERSRYEAENNSYYQGMLRTAGAHIIGRGPRLQVLTKSPDANARLEKAWRKWALANNFADELRVGVETYWRDGEVFFLRRHRSNTPIGRVGLKIMSYEGDQITSPYATSDEFIEDGIRLDNLNDPVEYFILNHHPGDLNVPRAASRAGKWYPAEDVVHLFRKERPGQLRGIPRIAASLELFPKLRRHTLATLAAAEAVTEWTLFMKTNSSAIMPKKMPDFISMDFARSMLTYLPDGWEPFQLKPEQPTTNHEMYQRVTLTEISRCAGQPYLLVAGTSKDSNYSSAQMDVRNIWGPEVYLEQDRVTTIALERFWGWFLEDSMLVPGLLDGLPEFDEIDHQWLFDPLPTMDTLEEAQAGEILMRSGQAFPAEIFARRGKDFDTAVRRAAADYGVSEDQVRMAIFLTNFPEFARATTGATETASTGSVVDIAGEVSKAKTRQQATQDALRQFINGKADESQTQQALQGLGWPQETAAQFLMDARDGRIDDPQLRAATPAQSQPRVAQVRKELAV